MRMPERVAACLAALLLGLLPLAAGARQDPPPPAATVADAAPAPRIGVLTMEPGEIFFERFGHNAVVVDDPAAGGPVSYNFGYFDPEEADFHLNFARGVMRYWLVALPLERDLAYYRQAGRGASIQWLALSPAQARALADDLAAMAVGDRARYDYEYFTSNCSTQVRDALDRALGGQLHANLSARSQGNTYRGEAVRLAAPAAWMALGFHLGLAGAADKPLSRWEEAFVPMRLRDSLRDVRLADGRALVASEESLLPHRLPLPSNDPPRVRGTAFLAGLALAAGTLLLGRRHPRLLAGLAGVFWLLAGLAGVVMAFLWLGSLHTFAHANQNLLLLSPLCLALLPGAWALARGREPGRWFRPLLLVVVAGAALAAFLKFLPFLAQENTEWVLLLLPLHWALLRRLAPRPD